MIGNHLTYISLFSSAGVGCYGFKQEDYLCIATNEYLQKRINIQKCNHKCKYDSGYIQGDITKDDIKQRIFDEIKKFKNDGNDDVDVLIATPPCQGMSVANRKRNDNEIGRNSLVVESILLIQQINPRFFVFENVSAFLKTGCTSPNGEIKEIGTVIDEELGSSYVIKSKTINFKKYGNNSSRTRTLVIGVRKDYEEFISPIDLFPIYQKETPLKDVIGHLPPLLWDEINKDDILHAFRTYQRHMECWIADLKEGESAFDNEDEMKRPHQIKDGVYIPNVRKLGNKYRRQCWNETAHCIHTRNDQLASQNTIHPSENRVFSIRELMLMMTIPDTFKWVEEDYDVLNHLSEEKKRKFYKENEIKIRQSIGEAVPTIIFQQIAHNIKLHMEQNRNCFKRTKSLINKIIKDNNLCDVNALKLYLKSNPDNISLALLSKIAEFSNCNREIMNAFYTNKSLLNDIYDLLPDTDEEEIHILEPSVGVGNFLPFLFKKYEDIPKVIIDVIDTDNTSLEILDIMLSKIDIPSNVSVNYIHADYMTFQEVEKYFLVIGNPPFDKIRRNVHKEYYETIFNQDTTNLAALFLEKAINHSVYTIMVEPKFIINTPEFEKTREFLNKYKINAIYDFGEKGFNGVLIETVCISVKHAKPTNNIVSIKHIDLGLKNEILQDKLTSNEYPYWILYRNDFFDNVASQMDFNMFSVFRDRQITNTDMNENLDNVRVLKSRNIVSNGIIDIDGYDGYIDIEILKEKEIYKFFHRDDVFLVPNMTYNPRMIRKPKDVVVNGSVAILIPINSEPTEEQMLYFASEEYKKFYQIARNYQTRSLNIDKTSVFFFGLKNR